MKATPDRLQGPATRRYASMLGMNCAMTLTTDTLTKPPHPFKTFENDVLRRVYAQGHLRGARWHGDAGRCARG
ncbi:hypothetical protein NOVOSPHI9U_10095 [Novosphingobium sp. 9U]|nr:hypothetical protein NOVOSPHI9U_10095 [Novosphingobium sp. 9U]